jgi:hypothetical protein
MEKNILLYCEMILFAAIFIFALAGCASISPDSSLEKNWGRAYENQLKLQTANPEAGCNVRPVTEMNGASADAVLETHVKTFESENR